jgi:NADH:ubiquinone oxidoreductase subunit E
MKEIIVKHLKKMEFVCGLKQFKEYKEDEAIELISCLHDLFKKFGWMTDDRVDYILQLECEGNTAISTMSTKRRLTDGLTNTICTTRAK